MKCILVSLIRYFFKATKVNINLIYEINEVKELAELRSQKCVNNYTNLI